MSGLNNRIIITVLFIMLISLYGCSSNISSSSEFTPPIVSSEPNSPSSSPSSEPVQESSDVHFIVSDATSSEEPIVTPPKTSDPGTPLTLSEADKKEMENFINLSVAAYSSFEADSNIDDILMISGMVLCTQEGKSQLLDNGDYGVDADVFNKLISDYFGRSIENPEIYNRDTDEVQYDGSYYRWCGSGFEPEPFSVKRAEDLGNQYIKCRISGMIENDYGEEMENNGVCILKKSSDSPFGFYFIACAMNE